MSAKYRWVAESLMNRIRRGEIDSGSRLPGEIDLAEAYDVSRGTIRQALARLQDVGLIETHTGAGSFVRYDGLVLDDRVGWSKALAKQGVETRTDILRLERIEDAPLAAELGLKQTTFLALDRLRRMALGDALSLERSRLPWRDAFGAILRDGLVENSLQRTLDALAIRSIGGSESVGIARLSAEEAALLRRDAGSAFLATRRIVHDEASMVIECVDSLLDPAHFRLHFRFAAGEP